MVAVTTMSGKKKKENVSVRDIVEECLFRPTLMGGHGHGRVCHLGMQDASLSTGRAVGHDRAVWQELNNISLSQEVLVDIPERITEHGLSSKITQSSGGSSDTNEGSENSWSFEDYWQARVEGGI
ncbi:hypothetical protein Tco_0806354 [Tanacetum coccineum]